MSKTVSELRLVAVQPEGNETLLLEELANFFHKCYGSYSVGENLHLSRMQESGTGVFYGVSPNGEIQVACYVRSDGKRGALGVCHGARGKGFAKRIIRFSTQFLSCQFTEIPSNNFRLQALFEREGFMHVASKRAVFSRFAGHEDLFVEVHEAIDRVVYTRKSEHRSQKKVSYVMMELN